MQQFPALKDNEVALMRAQFSTGHILDENINLAINDDQPVYTIFKNLDEAIIAAQKIIEENSSIECVIYGKENAFIKYVSPKK
jgi:hypothetical protein